jgi:hypothetical protein
MPDFEPSTLWPSSAFDRIREQTGQARFAKPGRQTTLSSTLQTELRALDRIHEGEDALAVVATCMRLREPALIHFEFEELVWPVTLFPADGHYHSRRSLLVGSQHSVASSLKVLGVEPADARPPGQWMHERAAHTRSYHLLTPMLWRIGLHAPRTALLNGIGGTAAYRVLRDPASDDLLAPGAMASAVEHLRRQTTALRTIADWPGMSVDRAIRLLNALYLTSNLIVSRTHPSARPEPNQPMPVRHMR